jgi:hypothetical protein
MGNYFRSKPEKIKCDHIWKTIECDRCKTSDLSMHLSLPTLCVFCYETGSFCAGKFCSKCEIYICAVCYRETQMTDKMGFNK